MFCARDVFEPAHRHGARDSPSIEFIIRAPGPFSSRLYWYVRAPVNLNHRSYAEDEQH